MIKKKMLAKIHEEKFQTHCLKSKGFSKIEEASKACGKWFTRVEGIDFKDILLFVVNYCSIRILMTIINQCNFELEQMDMKRFSYLEIIKR